MKSLPSISLIRTWFAGLQSYSTIPTQSTLLISGKPEVPKLPTIYYIAMIPVRVRGKKYRQKPVSLRMTQKAGSLAHVAEGQRKRAASLSTPASVLQKQARTHHNGTASETLSATPPLERLPTEILEMIFLYSLNLSLPRSSLLLGARLASNHMKTNLFLLVFPSKRDQLEHIEYLLSVLSTEDAIGNLQSDILSLKWVTPAFVRGMIETFMVRTIVRELKCHSLGWEEQDDNLKVGVNDKGIIENFRFYFNPRGGILDASKEATIDNVSRWYKHTVARCRTKQGPLFNCLQCIWEVKGINIRLDLHIWLLEGTIMKFFSEDLGVGKGIVKLAISSKLIHCTSNCKIPVKLLHGPWTAEKCDDLERICSGGGRIDQTGSTMDEEIAEAGLRDAIREGNQRAIITLVGSVGLLDPPRNDTDEICKGCYSAWTSAEQRPNNHCQLNAKCFVGIAVVTDHFKLALSRNCSYSILYSLLHAIKLDIDWADTEITAWAVRKRREGDDRGQWLLDRIASLNALRYEDSLTRCFAGMRE